MDVGAVYSRLFDHRAVLQGECKFVIREFESKRNDRALRLAEALKIVNEIQNKMPECKELAERINGVQDHLKDARQRYHNILEKEEKNLNKSRRQEIKEQSKKKWDEFLKEKAKEEEKIEKDFMTSL